jgi:DNA-binding NarL/FixJ family response regulator
MSEPSQDETAGQKIRALIVEEQTCVRTCIKLALKETHKHWHWMECGLGMDAIKICKTQKPDLMILDLGLPDICGVEVMRRLNWEGVRVNTLIHSGLLCRETLLAALQCAPLGFVEKNADLKDLREGALQVACGNAYFTQMAQQLLASADAGTGRSQKPLSKCETDVVRLIALGHTSKEAASILGISARTVEGHRAKIKMKLGFSDTANLTRYAIRMHVVSANTA